MIADILEGPGRETAAALAQSGAKREFVMLDVTDDEQWAAPGPSEIDDARVTLSRLPRY